MDPELNKPLIPTPKIRLTLLIYTLLVSVVSLLPGSGASYGQADKVGHFIAYAGMAVLAMMSFKGRISRIAGLLGAIGVGALLEWGQSFIPGRDMSLLDGAANALGVLAGALFFRFWGEALIAFIQSKLPGRKI